jgi:hypothetical protein
MKVGVFGCSFASERVLFSAYKNYKYLEDFGKPWAWYLQDRYKSWKIKNFSVPGSCFYYSYKKYLENRDEFDKIIFVCTDHSRISRMSNTHEGYVLAAPNIDSAIAKEKLHNGEEKLFFKSAINYFAHMQDVEKDKIIYNLIYEDIKKDPKVFRINAFPYVIDTEDNLYKIQWKETATVFDNYNIWEYQKKGIIDMRYNHLTGDNNRILAKEISRQINAGCKELKVDINKFQFSKEKIEKYFLTEKYLLRNQK